MEGERVRLIQALLASDRMSAEALLDSLAQKAPPIEIAEQVVVPALVTIGDMWSQGQASLTQVYMSSRICEGYLDKVLPPESPHRKYQPRMAIASLDDHHTLGKSLVFSTIRANGFELQDLGTLSAEELASKAKEERIEVLLVSTLMLRSALQVKELKGALDRNGWKPHLIVGGAPFILDPSLWTEVGASSVGRDSSDALDLVHAYMEGRR